LAVDRPFFMSKRDQSNPQTPKDYRHSYSRKIKNLSALECNP
jgi:hypothetical protein